ncbi:MAG: nitroreductase family protein [Prevotellaceae bacterium]|nr:nitroreductase family protein [Prevotellaceae bacterium]
MKITIDEAACLKCLRCLRVCPSGVYEAEGGQAPRAVAPEGCISCGHCVDVCPAGCVRHESFPEGTVREIRAELLPRPGQLMELMRSRRSNRTITSRPVPEEALKDILEAARYAPTAENSRRVAVTVISSPDSLQAIEDAVMRLFLSMKNVLTSAPLKPLTRALLPNLYAEAPGLERFRLLWEAGKRPCLCEGTALLVFSAPKGYDFGWQDCNLAYQNASLMAEAHGVSQIYMGLVQTALRLMRKRRVSQLLSLPRGHRPYALMSLGVPALRYPRYTVRE